MARSVDRVLQQPVRHHRDGADLRGEDNAREPRRTAERLMAAWSTAGRKSVTCADVSNIAFIVAGAPVVVPRLRARRAAPAWDRPASVPVPLRWSSCGRSVKSAPRLPGPTSSPSGHHDQVLRARPVGGSSFSRRTARPSTSTRTSAAWVSATRSMLERPIFCSARRSRCRTVLRWIPSL